MRTKNKIDLIGFVGGRPRPASRHMFPHRAVGLCRRPGQRHPISPRELT